MMAKTGQPAVGVVLMSFGSAATAEDVPAYLASVRGGHPAPKDLVTEFQRRYRVVGGSPLVQITLEQASALEALLNAAAAEGKGYRVLVGMRHAPPWISSALAQLAAEGVTRVIAIILSPQYSPIIMGGYHRAIQESQSVLAPEATARVAGAWHLLPSFLEALAQRVREGLDRLPPQERESVPVLMTAHSLPRSVVDREPSYIDQLQETARAVAERAELLPGRWQFAYQSAGHTPEEWLKPDLKDLFPGLRQAGHRRVLVVPIQFLADHLEILYDIDVAARAEAEEMGLAFSRIEMFNAMPAFIRALADVVHRELAA
jgi:ferrochelatase